MTSLALARDPDTTEDTPFTFREASPETAGIPTNEYTGDGGIDPTPAGNQNYGMSVWAYKDSSDGTAYKYEGSYRRFQDQTGLGLYSGSPDAYGDSGSPSKPPEGSGPHGDYATTTSKCKTCHAVHRASGAYKLLRSDDPDDACAYCHVGDHRHSIRAAYFAGNGDVYPNNGHTIGAGKLIPDSSVSQWLESKQITATGTAPSGVSITIQVRRYNTNRNKIFKITYDAVNGTYLRVGPTYLYCMSCHQVHRATNLIWKPKDAPTWGYKLLRNSPSGSVKDASAMENYTALNNVALANVIKAIEDTLNAGSTGWDNTIYTSWKGPELVINSANISVWCADCHNLNIGHFEDVEESNFSSNKYHSDRTHTVPYVGKYDSFNNGTQPRLECYSCHIGGETTLDFIKASQFSTTVGEEATSTPPAAVSGNDWPHAAATNSTKLLGDDYTVGSGSNWDPIANEHLDRICTRCHTSIGTSQ
jgi:hypothetical protein